MKKLFKILVVVLALTLTFAMSTGFTYEADSQAEPQGAITSHNIKPNAENDVIHIATGDTLRFNFGYTGPIYKVNINNSAYGNFTFSSAYGTSVLDLDGLADGSYKVSFQTSYGTEMFYEYSVVVVVGNDQTAPPILTTATVKYYSDTEVISSVVSSYESNFDTQLTNIPTNPPVKVGYRFVTWAFWNNTISEWVNFDTTNVPKVTENMLMNGVFKVAPIYKEIKELELTYHLQEDGFLWFEGWKEFYTVTVPEGSFIPDVSHKFGVAFDKMTFDEKGSTPITATTTADITRTDIYVHLNEIQGIQVKYMSGVYSAFDSELLYGVYEYDYVTSGDTFKMKQAPALEVKSLTDSITYDFMYWSTDKGGNDRIEADAIITEDVTVYAQYDQIQVDTGFKLFFSRIHDFVEWVDNTTGINNMWITYIVCAGLLLLAVALVVKIVKSLF